MITYLDKTVLDLALQSLAIRLEENGSQPFRLVICGGSALLLANLIPRSTKDVDIVALITDTGLVAPTPFPAALQRAAMEVAEDLNLDSDWLNNGPSRDEGGLFQLGLPDGLEERLHIRGFSACLVVYYIDRVDQIHFKLYASVDRGGYHINDLLSLHPSENEIEAGARWSMTHDVSEGYAQLLKTLLRELGYEAVAHRL